MGRSSHLGSQYHLAEQLRVNRIQERSYEHEREFDWLGNTGQE